MRILVTGAEGSIGSLLVPTLRQQGHIVLDTDIETMNVNYPETVRAPVETFKPDIVYHLAGAKHAPEGECNPHRVSETNSVGTWNVVRACQLYAPSAKVILASTCKAADPETAYGASKLIAERIVLNAGGVVVRYYNVRETAGNVFRIWEQIPKDDPIPWTDCWRYFITAKDAIALTLAGAWLPSGRYTVNPGPSVRMYEEAKRLYPGRELREIPPRRGDRRREPLHARCETVRPYGNFLRIENPHDPVGAIETDENIWREWYERSRA